VFFCLIFIACLSGCSKKDESRGFEPVSQAEAEAFAKQLLEKFKQGDKSAFFSAGTDLNVLIALWYFAETDIPDFVKKANEQERQTHADNIVAMNHILFDSLKSVELVEVQEKYGVFYAVLDCKFDQTVKTSVRNPSVRNRKFPFTLLKKKATGEIIVVGIGIPHTTFALIE
jgi:hypothetical protein